MVGWHCDHTVPGSRVPPLPQVDGGTEQAQHVCPHSQGRGGSEETQAKWKLRAERAPSLAGTEMAAELPPG